MTNTFGIYYILISIVILIIILSLIFMIIFFRTRSEKRLHQLIYLLFAGSFIICISLFYHFYNYLTGLKHIILIEGGRYNINILNRSNLYCFFNTAERMQGANNRDIFGNGNEEGNICSQRAIYRKGNPY